MSHTLYFRSKSLLASITLNPNPIATYPPLMSSNALLLILLSAAIHVGWNALIKSSANPRTFAFLKGSLLTTGTIALLPFFPLEHISTTIWVCIILSGIIHFVYMLALSSAYETGDISFVYPIARSAPAFVPIAAYIFLDETLSARGITGICLVVICIFFLQFRGEAASRFRRLSQSIKQPDFGWAILTLLSVVAYTIVDKIGMVAFHDITNIKNLYHGPIYFALETTIATTIYGTYLGRNIAIRSTWSNEWTKVLPAAIGTLVSYTLILHVMQTETVSYIVTLRQSSVLMAVLIGGITFDERLGITRLTVATAMLVGFYLVSTS